MVICHYCFCNMLRFFDHFWILHHLLQRRSGTRLSSNFISFQVRLSITHCGNLMNFLQLLTIHVKPIFLAYLYTKFEFLKSNSRLDHDSPQNVTCGSLKSYLMYPPGDFSSDAQFFVFTGVVSFLGTMASLVVYVFFSEMYLSEQKRAPMFVSIRFSDFYPRQIMFHMHGNAHLRSSTLWKFQEFTQLPYFCKNSVKATYESSITIP